MTLYLKINPNRIANNPPKIISKKIVHGLVSNYQLLDEKPLLF